MKKLIHRVEDLKKSTLKEVVDSRMKEFEYFLNAPSEEIFLELCFCFMTANFQAEKSWTIQKEIGSGFWRLDLNELEKELKIKGHRFWSQRAKRIYDARYLKNMIKDKLKEFDDERDARLWIVKNVKGLGMKEASHFLRNVGYKNVAIIDKHIINLLVEEGLIERPKTLTPKKYFEIEKVLEKLAKETNLNLGELDLYLWQEKTGKVLK